MEYCGICKYKIEKDYQDCPFCGTGKFEVSKLDKVSVHGLKLTLTGENNSRIGFSDFLEQKKEELDGSNSLIKKISGVIVFLICLFLGFLIVNSVDPINYTQQFITLEEFLTIIMTLCIIVSGGYFLYYAIFFQEWKKYCSMV